MAKINKQEQLWLVKHFYTRLKERITDTSILESIMEQIKNDIEYIEDQFEELRVLYGNHNQSANELKRVEPDMIRHKTNISDKIDKIKLELYDM